MASRQRASSAGTSRAASAFLENKSLRDVINRLQQELLHCKADNQRVTEQLSCMMLLVKRAWQGDMKAAVDVANIVGVAPPDMDENTGAINATPKSPCARPDIINILVDPAKKKSRAVNNWAVLTIGILNKEYKAIEEQTEARQQYYLHQRQAYLDDQLMYHKDLQAKVLAEINEKLSKEAAQKAATSPQNIFEQIARNKQLSPETRKPLQRSNSVKEISNRRVKSASFAERGTQFMIQGNPEKARSPTRPATAKTHKIRLVQKRPDMAWTELVIDPTKNRIPSSKAEAAEQSTHKLDSAQGETESVAFNRYQKRRLPYDDPHRYDQCGLFDPDSVLGRPSSASKNRPISAKQQRDGDELRSRPRSAVLKGERQMKYEVVRPISAKAKCYSASKISPGNKPPSGRKQRKMTGSPDLDGSFTFVNENNNRTEDADSDTDFYMRDGSDTEISVDTHRVAYDQKAFEKLGIDLAELEKEEKSPPMRVNITKPQCVVDFEQDVDKMQSMEKEIKKATRALQKRLGINAGGLV